jgi:hypothetical protein
MSFLLISIDVSHAGVSPWIDRMNQAAAAAVAAAARDDAGGRGPVPDTTVERY